MSGINHTTKNVGSTGVQNVDGLLSGKQWADATVTYSFPSFDEYSNPYGLGENGGQFGLTAKMQTVVHFALNTWDGNAANDGFAVEGFTKLNIYNIAEDDAHMRFSQTTLDPYNFDTAWTYAPSTAETGGDSWFTNEVHDYSVPVSGGYSFFAILHEVGHGLGLKHAHEGDNFGEVPGAYDAMEYSAMSYRSYEGATTADYGNEKFGYAQSWMMLDIAALQHMYGANYDTNKGDTVYRWTPVNGRTIIGDDVAISPAANRIFATIWDGGGTDTFDLSAYETALNVDLEPGKASVFSSGQLADLGDGVKAAGNIYNALLHEGDTRSLIENVIGGTGDDTIRGNQAANMLRGGNGDDILDGREGDDVLDGETGNDRSWGRDGDDTLFGRDGQDHLHGDNGDDRLFGGSGEDTLEGGEGNDALDGGEDNDRLIGGQGDDRLRGASGNDVLNGQAGNDTIFANSGTDRISGGGGQDSLFGGADRDVMRGNSGNDTLRGGAGNDRMSGNAGNDIIVGWNGHDTAIGGGGDDFIRGGKGNDRLVGNNGDDRIEGNAGNDLLIGGGGADTLIGGGGADVFRFKSVSDSPVGGAADRIVDFTRGSDVIDLSALTTSAVPLRKLIGHLDGDGPGVIAHIKGSDTSVRVDHNGDGLVDFVVLVKGVTDLDASDFIL